MLDARTGAGWIDQAQLGQSTVREVEHSREVRA
jgi:hypothetical protein